ncbi:cupin domain-containing protein [Brevundimonas bullata]|uniref:cupin domain-containing protein n=1 Tax=Brevundimonas bullata TaxID=13160 RepID=UPI000E0C32AE|nr:cupin domain-containing protein [Brevundimonas bullata]WQE37559.1 cupin domain-containing protein [Brevundimonas bullata]
MTEEGEIVFSADEIIANLSLAPHTEGGHFRTMARDSGMAGCGSEASTDYRLVTAGEEGEWRFVDTTEIWAFYMGAPLSLEIVTDQGLRPRVLSPDCPQAAAPQGAWRRLRSLGDWTLASCSTAPGLAADAVETPSV